MCVQELGGVGSGGIPREGAAEVGVQGGKELGGLRGGLGADVRKLDLVEELLRLDWVGLGAAGVEGEEGVHDA